MACEQHSAWGRLDSLHATRAHACSGRTRPSDAARRARQPAAGLDGKGAGGAGASGLCDAEKLADGLVHLGLQLGEQRRLAAEARGAAHRVGGEEHHTAEQL